jgi:hypothetical protein
MHFSFTWVAVLLLLGGVSTVTSTLAAEQKMLFCAESIAYSDRWGHKDFVRRACSKACEKYTSPTCLQDNLATGWMIVSASPKSVLVEMEEDASTDQCQCEGSQYVLNKPDEKPITPATDSNEVILLKKEIELLKKENLMIQKELNEMKIKATAPAPVSKKK